MGFNIDTAVLLVSLVVCVYLLTVLWHIHHVHRSMAWRFIFTGLTLLLVECALRLIPVADVITDTIILAKAVCYAIGFTIWKRDIDWLKTLAKSRREQVIKEAVEEVANVSQD